MTCELYRATQLNTRQLGRCWFCVTCPVGLNVLKAQRPVAGGGAASLTSFDKYNQVLTYQSGRRKFRSF